MLHIDWETFGEVELRGKNSVGLHNYFLHPRTELLMLAWAFDDELPECWEIHKEPMPDKLRKGLEDSKQLIAAWTSTFERYGLWYKVGMKIPIERFADPQASARYLSLPDDLETAGLVLGLPPEMTKNADGERLIGIFSKPQVIKKKSQPVEYRRRDWNTDPEDWAKFCQYNKQDVVAEREIMRRLRDIYKVFPLPEREQRIWQMDQRINDRGIPVDIKFVEMGLKLATHEKNESKEQQNGRTGLANANSRNQLLDWVKTQGYAKNTLKKGAVEAELKFNENLTPLCREVLEARKDGGSTSYKKLAAILRQVSPDGRLRNQFIYMGSSRCGRWSGNAVQLQNLARPSPIFENLETVSQARQMIIAGEYDAIRECYGSVLTTVKSCLRTAFLASLGKKFDVADLSAIETRVGAWVTGCKALMKVFEQGRDPYLDYASKLTQIPYETLERDLKSKDPVVKARAKALRQMAKPVVLGCFGASTEVLTNRGWVPISQISIADRIFDGHEWVEHSGIIFQGNRTVVDFSGVQVTPDHEFLVRENTWRTAWDVNLNTQLEKQAISLATGLYSKVVITQKGKGANTCVSAVVEKHNGFLGKVWNAVLPRVVELVRRSAFRKKGTGFMFDSPTTQENVSIVWRTATTPSYRAAVVSGVADIGTEGVGLNAFLIPFMSSLNTRYPWITGISRIIKSTVSKMTAIMKLEISDLRLLPTITEIKKRIIGLSIKANNIVQSILETNLPQDTEMQETLRGKFAKVFLPSRLSKIKIIAEVPTYDILNCGPRNQFLIRRKDGGILVAHNCIYQLGGGSITVIKGDATKGGLWGYAENYGVAMTQEEAANHVKLFRDAYPEIPEFWYACERAVAEVLAGTRTVRELGPNGCIKVDKINIQDRDPVLRIQLPSNRYLHYVDAHMESLKMPWKDREGNDVYRDGLVYSGVSQTTHQWDRGITSRGGKETENIVQAIARDVLADDMLDCEDLGIEINAHAHDEIIAENEDSFCAPGLIDMESIMAKPNKFLPGLLLKGEGFSSDFYRKG